jgi:hypothetical protein
MAQICCWRRAPATPPRDHSDVIELIKGAHRARLVEIYADLEKKKRVLELRRAEIERELATLATPTVPVAPLPATRHVARRKSSLEMVADFFLMNQ